VSNPYYIATGTPGTGSQGASAPIRAEYSSIETGFDKLPNYQTATPGAVVIVNGTNTALIPSNDIIFPPGGGAELTGPVVINNPNDFANILLIKNSASAIRFGVDGGIASIEGVDPTGVGSFQRLEIGGSIVQLWTNTPTGNSYITMDNGIHISPPLEVGSGGTGTTSIAGIQTSLGLGTAAYQNIGTSGYNVPLMGNNNTWAWQHFSNGGFDVGDGNYYFQITNGHPTINFDANDYFLYDRNANYFEFFSAGTARFRITEVGDCIAGRDVWFGNDGSFAAIGGYGQYPQIKFDSGDEFYYDRVNNGYGFQIAAINIVTFDDINGLFYSPGGNTRFQVQSGGALYINPALNGGFYITQDTDNAYINFDSSGGQFDFPNYYRPSNLFNFQVNGQQKFSVDGVGNGVFAGNVQANGGTFVNFDSNCYWGTNANDSFITFTAAGDYIHCDRVNHVIAVGINNSQMIWIDAGGIHSATWGTFNNGVGFSASGTFQASGDNNYSIVQMDTNDLYYYDRVNNMHAWRIGGTDYMTLQTSGLNLATWINFPNNMGVYFGNSFGIRLNGTQPYFELEPSNAAYLAQDQTNHVFRIGEGGSDIVQVRSNGIQMFGTERINCADETLALHISGVSKGIRMLTHGNGSSIEGVDSTGVGSFQPLTFAGSMLIFAGNSSQETGRVGASTYGYTKLTNDGNYYHVDWGTHEIAGNTVNGWALYISNNQVTSPYGAEILYLGSAPNNTGNNFLTCGDNAVSRLSILSNGGIANYAGNNINWSDAGMKTEIAPYDGAILDALEAGFQKIDWGRFKYLDQTHKDWNHGFTAQGVQAAFASVAPELVDNFDMMLDTKDGVMPGGEIRKGVYQTDLMNISMALLARALKRIKLLEDN